ncbi:MAG: adenylate/guanylate cyclase domain-containing protein [Rectinemataceae bacterium]|jgi:class 3 adenylate cyclase
MEKIESERRQATIIFADISGFTEMSEKLDPEEVTTIMGDCFAVLGAVVSDYGGIVDKYIGDCVMALFGAPRALENAPQKAIAAGLKMLAEIKILNLRHKLAKPLGLHIGVNTGEVLSGEVGSKEKRDFTVMGDAVNLASRLKGISGSGRIVVGPQTWRYARESFRFKPLRPIGVKGKEGLVQADRRAARPVLHEGTHGPGRSRDRRRPEPQLPPDHRHTEILGRHRGGRPGGSRVREARFGHPYHRS